MDHPSPRFWIVVGSPDNFRRSAELGFTLQGFKTRHRKKAAEDYPHRGRTSPDLIVGEEDAAPAEPIPRRMAYAAKWPAEHWTLAFQGNLHEIPASDYALIRAGLEARAAAVAASDGER